MNPSDTKSKSKLLISLFLVAIVIVLAYVFVPKSVWKKIFSLNFNNFAAAFETSTSGDWNSTTTWGTNGGLIPFSSPYDVAISSTTGEIYVADTDNNRIVVLNPDGSASTTYDGGTLAPFNSPRGIVLDSSGYIYVSNFDSGDNRIVVLNPDGTASTSYTGISQPVGMAISSLGYIYVAAVGNNNLAIRNPDGSASTTYDGTGQGHNGGNGTGDAAPNYAQAGGGGAGAVGDNGNNSTPHAGDGGVGLAFSISGTSTYYAGGGGGPGIVGGATYGLGGLGGGGDGGTSTGIVGSDGVANTGGGGGAAHQASGGTGGSGIVIVRYLTSDASGLTISGGASTTDGSYTVLTFNASDTLSISGGSLNIELLMVAGGGGGGGGAGAGGGGGAGGLIHLNLISILPDSYPVVIGAGGAHGVNGEDTTFDGLTAIGGGTGDDYESSTLPQVGGSGGGGGYVNPTGAAAFYANGLSIPTGVALDSSGNIYVSDYNHNRVLRLIEGVPVGSYNGDSFATVYPKDVALDSLGNILITDDTNDRVVVLNPDGTASTSYDSVGLSGPTGIVLSSSGEIYIADTNNNRIAILNPDGTASTSYDGTQLPSGYTPVEGVDYPGSTDDATIDNGTVTLQQDQSVLNLTLATSGTLDLNGYTLNVYGNWTNTGGTLEDTASTSLGTINFVGTSTQIISGENTFPNLTKFASTSSSLLFDPLATTTITGNLFLSGDSSSTLLSIAPSIGSVVPQFAYYMNNSNSFSNPSGITHDSHGNVYVSDYSNDTIQEFGSDGNFIKNLDTTGIPNPLNFPFMLASDGSDNIYAIDYGDSEGTGRIVKFNSSGVYSTSSGSLNTQSSIAVDSSGTYIYITDYDVDGSNSRGIDKLDSNFNIIATTTNPDHNFFSLNWAGMSLDSTGNFLYIADDGNNRIIKFNTSDLSYVSETDNSPDTFSQPSDVTLDSQGNIYVLDQFNERVVKLASDYSFLAQFGSFGGEDGNFILPTQATIDSSNNVYVTDVGRDDFQKFTQSSSIFNILHTGVASTSVFSFLHVAGSTNLSDHAFDCTNGCVNGGFNTNWTFPTVARTTGSGRRTLAPTVSISAASTNIPYNSSTTISWNSQYVNYCTVTENGINFRQETSGINIPTGSLTSDTVFTVTCIGAFRKEASASVTITVSSSGGASGISSNLGNNPEASTTEGMPALIHNFLKNLRIGNSGDEVKFLQQFLNTHGFIIATEGPGSPGNETNKFGSLTKSAVIKLQEANFDAILKPLKLTRGTGNFFEYTRAYVNSVLAK